MYVGDNFVRAVHTSTCKRCGTLISPGHKIIFDNDLRLYVHADCAKICSLVTTSVLPAKQQSRINGLPHGLKPKSLQSYTVEWNRYVRFIHRRGLGAIPGKDVPWDIPLIAEFMEFRAKTCKPSTLTSIWSILSHFGTMFGFLLPNSPDDDDSLSYRRICKIKKQMNINFAVENGGPDAPFRCTPLGHQDVALLLSAYGVVDRESFAALSRRNRHHLFCAVVQHAKGMRFGHFIYRSYKVNQFVQDVSDGSFLLMTDWHRFAGRTRYALRFESFPVESYLWYELRDTDGNVKDIIAAATLMSWHFDIVTQCGETKAFDPVPGTAPTRSDRAMWLRDSFLAALPLQEHAARQLVTAISPHSFRPGIAGDMRRAGKRMDQISFELRWRGLKNARMYSARPPLFSARVSAKFKLIHQ